MSNDELAGALSYIRYVLLVKFMRVFNKKVIAPETNLANNIYLNLLFCALVMQNLTKQGGVLLNLSEEKMQILE